jgi:hypothetical protein
VVRSATTLTNPAITSVKRWKLKPGELDGAPISSETVVALVFRWPTTSFYSSRKYYADSEDTKIEEIGSSLFFLMRGQ